MKHQTIGHSLIHSFVHPLSINQSNSPLAFPRVSEAAIELIWFRL